MGQLIADFTTPIDPGGGGNRTYTSDLVGAGWTHMYATFSYNLSTWPGAFEIGPGGVGSYDWFNGIWGASPVTLNDPTQTTVTGADWRMSIDTNGVPAGLQVRVQLYGDQTGVCSAGSRAKATSPTFFTYTEGDLASVLPGYLGLIIWGLLGIPTSPQYTPDFCSVPPPTDLPTTADFVKLAFPPIALLTGTYRRFANQVFADKWGSLCECIPPGSYTPPSPPAPPAGWPGLPAPPTCSTIQDVCGQLQVVQQQLTMLQQYLATSSAPSVHSYAESTRHTNLTGSGAIALESNALAVRVDITTDDANLPTAVGNPTFLFNRGFIVPIGAEGPIRGQVRLTYNPQVFVLPNLTTQIGYTFPPTITVRITELTAGP